MEEPIGELEIQQLTGEFYNLFRKYLEKHGCIWTDRRDQWGYLLSVHLAFPPGTVYRELASSDHYRRYRITLQMDGVMYWFVHQMTGFNSMSIPYVYL
jgi:hypothetical protein